jgi:hypothetical protein
MGQRVTKSAHHQTVYEYSCDRHFPYPPVEVNQAILAWSFYGDVVKQFESFSVVDFKITDN